MKHLLAIAICAVALQAGAQQQGFTSIGPGSSTCGNLTQAENDSKREGPTIVDMFGGWMQGFLTGLNYQRAIDKGRNSQMVLLPDYPTVKAALSKYCRDNPLEIVATGGLTIYSTLKRQQGLTD